MPPPRPGDISPPYGCGDSIGHPSVGRGHDRADHAGPWTAFVRSYCGGGGNVGGRLEKPPLRVQCIFQTSIVGWGLAPTGTLRVHSSPANRTVAVDGPGRRGYIPTLRVRCVFQTSMRRVGACPHRELEIYPRPTGAERAILSVCGEHL